MHLGSSGRMEYEASWEKRSHQNLHMESGPVSLDRKSTRLNSSHSQISYAVFCLKKKNSMEVTSSSPTRWTLLWEGALAELFFPSVLTHQHTSRSQSSGTLIEDTNRLLLSRAGE